MSDDRRTKVQILEELDRITAENQKLRAAAPDRPVRVPEAEALAECIRALDKLKGASRGSGYGYTNEPKSEVSRTILALSERYGIPRVERVPEPCARRHMEDINAMDVLTAVRRDFEGMNL